MTGSLARSMSLADGAQDVEKATIWRNWHQRTRCKHPKEQPFKIEFPPPRSL